MCRALEDFPNLNSSVHGDSLVLHPSVNLAIAVDLGAEGLVAPVIKSADRISVAQLADAIAEIAQRSRAGKLKPDDFAGGTYTLSNSGTFGTLITAPIINQPQVAILSTDGVRKKPVVVETSRRRLDRDSARRRARAVVRPSRRRRRVLGRVPGSRAQDHRERATGSSKSERDSMAKHTLGWVGAGGRMGFAMAKRLLAAGHEVSVYNRTRSKVEPLAALGAKIVDRRARCAATTSCSRRCRRPMI